MAKAISNKGKSKRAHGRVMTGLLPAGVGEATGTPMDEDLRKAIEEAVQQSATPKTIAEAIERDNKPADPGKWEPTVISEEATGFPGQVILIPVRPQFDFVAERATFVGCPPGTRIQRIIFGDHVVLANAAGVLVEEWRDLGLEKTDGWKLGAKIRGGLDITVTLQLPGLRPTYPPPRYSGTVTIPWPYLRPIEGFPFRKLAWTERTVPVLLAPMAPATMGEKLTARVAFHGLKPPAPLLPFYYSEMGLGQLSAELLKGARP